MFKFIRVEFLLMFLLGIAFIGAFETILSYQALNCFDQQKHQRADSSHDSNLQATNKVDDGGHEKKRPSVSEPFVCGIAGSPAALRQFMNHNEGFFVGGFTFLLVFVTGWLVWATLKLWRGAENTAQRQLRAYVSMQVNEFGGLLNGYIRITFNVLNHGSTPAFGIRHVFNIDILDNPLPSNFQFPPATAPVNSDTTLFPNASFEARFFTVCLATPSELTAIEANTKRFYCWGTTFYVDTFGTQQQTSFNVSAGGKDFCDSQTAFVAGTPAPKWGWNFGPKHNHAT